MALIKIKNIFDIIIELIVKIIIPAKKINGKRMKKIKLNSGKNCQKYQNHSSAGWALSVIIAKYIIRYLFFANVFVVLGPSLIEDGIEILNSL